QSRKTTLKWRMGSSQTRKRSSWAGQPVRRNRFRLQSQPRQEPTLQPGKAPRPEATLPSLSLPTVMSTRVATQSPPSASPKETSAGRRGRKLVAKSVKLKATPQPLTPPKLGLQATPSLQKNKK